MRMNRIYLLNAFALNMVPLPSIVRIESVTPEQAREIIKGKQLANAIGHEVTAQLMGMLLGMELKANRIQVKMDVSDEALVLTLNQRLQEGQVIRNLEELNKLGYTLYHVTISQ